MFYPVKILDARGNVKKVLTSREISRLYWNRFFGGRKGRANLTLGKKRNALPNRPEDFPESDEDEFALS